MKSQILIFLFSTFTYAQLGINTDNPKALLNIEATDTNNPTGKDGIIIPKVSNFPTNAKAKGQLVFLENNSNLENGFYYWDGIDWNSLIINNFTRTVDKSIYVATGNGYSGEGITENDVEFENFTSFDTTDFSLVDNKLTIGKTGYYLINFNSSLKKEISSYRSLYTYKIKKNNTAILSTSNSIPNEITTATSVSLSGMVRLEKNDVINVTVIKSNENNATNEYIGYGTNSLTLTLLR